MDSAYLSKADLQSKADTLLEEVDFMKYLFQSVSEYLKYFYEMMSSVLIRNPSLLYICQGVWDIRGGGLTSNLTPGGASPQSPQVCGPGVRIVSTPKAQDSGWGPGDGRWEIVTQSLLLSGKEG